MLHSTLPRAFLPPGLSYLGGYYGEDAHLYTAAASAGYAPCIEDPYARIPEQRVHLGAWESSARPMSPCPLDLSLKAPQQSANAPGEPEALEVDDEEDRRCRVDLQRRILPSKRSYSNSEEMGSVVEESESEIRRSPSVHSYHSYEDVLSSHKEPMEHRSSLQNPLLQEENIRGLVLHRYHNFEDVPTKKEALDPREFSHKGHPITDPSSASIFTEPEGYHPLTGQKDSLIASPNHSRTLNYHQQLLLTPQHHLQVNAPMTPPSTPSPPQCPRRRAREDPEVTPPHSATCSSVATPKSAGNLTEKGPAARPKKKHARRLKFDEDTSSPVSGTVILGPDEAVVTGDIDPAFNIVEVTEEARAELAKIENRLGPYQCKLCRQLHEDAFQLAQHRCSRIAHVEYRCPECDKRFSCPANLASHRRWHKPRIANGETSSAGNPGTSVNGTSQIGNKDSEIGCTRCDAKFTRPAALRKHLATQHPESNNNVSIGNNNNNANCEDNSSGFHESGSMLGKTLCVPGNMHLVNASLTNEIP